MAEFERDIEERFRRHRHAKVIGSVPGFGPVLGSEVLAVTGSDFSAFKTADRLAGIAGSVRLVFDWLQRPGIRVIYEHAPVSRKSSQTECRGSRVVPGEDWNVVSKCGRFELKLRLKRSRPFYHSRKPQRSRSFHGFIPGCDHTRRHPC